MKILWLINIMLPQIAEAEGKKINNTGGWLVSLSQKIPIDHELVVCYPDSENHILTVESAKYYGCRLDDNEENLERTIQRFIEILHEEKPDVIHIWGTEHLQSYAMTVAGNRLGLSDKIVISIQGMVSYYALHYMACMPRKVQKMVTIRDAIRRDSMEDQQKDMERRGKFEIQAIRNVEHVIGRTNWDYICAKLINNNIKYHYNNETLRESFYEGEWSINECERYSLFVSQAQTPIKGFHFVLEAASMLIKKYPELKIYIAGGERPFDNSFKARGYSKYLAQLCKKYNLIDVITCVGNLSENEMKKQFLRTHVYVNASSIENSPNSVGEAMILGVPTIASYVGGTSNMLRDKVDGFLYQYDAPYMLAGYIDMIFGDDNIANEFSQSARRHAMMTHDRERNYQELISIYKKL